MLKSLENAPKRKKGTWKPSESHINSVKEKLSKPINCYDLFGHFIATYKSSVEAEKLLKVDLSHIAEAATGRRKTCGGYQWRYTNEVDYSDIAPVYKNKAGKI